MSMWVRVLSTKALGDLTPEELRRGLGRWLSRVAEDYGEDHEGVLSRVRVEGAAPLRGGAIQYGAGTIRFERTTDREGVEGEVAKLSATIEGSDEEGVEEVQELLGDVVEIAKLELSLADCEGIGWPIAIAAAAYLAERGEGIVQADREGWMAPEDGALEQVLDGD
jgi:hypothetical protein